MQIQGLGRGFALLEGGGRIGAGPAWLARMFAGGFHRLLDQIDQGLEYGTIRTVLPEGTTRTLGGRRPGFEATVTIHDWRALWRLATTGSVGWYQAWEAGEWDSPDPVPLFALFMANGEALGDAGRAHGPWRLLARVIHWLNRNSRKGARRNIQLHYDLGNDFYAQWLDPTMSYSSALFDRGGMLEQGQRRKWARLAERLGSPGTLLEIGCGWGGLSSFMAERGARVTAISLSDEQLEWAKRHQPGKVDYRKPDYRDIHGQFDAIVSVEMVEAVGRQYWPAYMDCIARCLKSGGRAAIQFISMKEALFEHYATSADFIQAYIFPGGLLIREKEFRRLAAERLLSWEDQQDFGPDYAETLRLWRMNFDAADAEGRLPPDVDERFRNLWRYYLMYCEGGFRGGGITVSQVTLVKSAHT